MLIRRIVLQEKIETKKLTMKALKQLRLICYEAEQKPVSILCAGFLNQTLKDQINSLKDNFSTVFSGSSLVSFIYLTFVSVMINANLKRVTIINKIEYRLPIYFFLLNRSNTFCSCLY